MKYIFVVKMKINDKIVVISCGLHLAFLFAYLFENLRVICVFIPMARPLLKRSFNGREVFKR